jgi:hypothetical protein
MPQHSYQDVSSDSISTVAQVTIKPTEYTWDAIDIHYANWQSAVLDYSEEIADFMTQYDSASTQDYERLRFMTEIGNAALRFLEMPERVVSCINQAQGYLANAFTAVDAPSFVRQVGKANSLAQTAKNKIVFERDSAGSFEELVEYLKANPAVSEFNHAEITVFGFVYKYMPFTLRNLSNTRSAKILCQQNGLSVNVLFPLDYRTLEDAIEELRNSFE